MAAQTADCRQGDGGAQLYQQEPEGIHDAESGDLYALVTCAAQRNDAYPDVPCTAEIGIESTLGYYRVFTALEGTPDAAIDSFAAAVKRAVEDPEWQEWLAANGMTNDYVWDKEELAAVLKNTYDSTVALSAQ